MIERDILMKVDSHPISPMPEGIAPESKPKIEREPKPDLQTQLKAGSKDVRKAQDPKKIAEDDAGDKTAPTPKVVVQSETSVRLEIDPDLGIVIAKIVDKDTNEVIRQVPMEDLVRLAKKFKGKGMLVNQEG